MIQKRYLLFVAFLIATLLVIAISIVVILAAGKPQSTNTVSSMKGFELYCWSDAGVTRYTLMTGTNRAKTEVEVTAGTDQIDTDGFTQFVNKSQTEIIDIYYRYFNIDDAEARANIKTCIPTDTLAD
jgi:hypothetical protein